MANIFKIAVIPLDIAWADFEENLTAVEKWMKAVDSDTDLVVLPELFSTGFVQEKEALRVLSENISGRTLEFIGSLARRYHMAIAGSYLFFAGTRYYNRGFFVESSGDEKFYDKRHLFSLSAENELYSRGDSVPFSVRYRGWNISMVICYDLRFPVWCRNKNMNYDIMLVPANWPTSRRHAWETLLKARAIENQAVYVGADRSGSDDFGDYDSMALIIDETGHQISSVEPASGIVYAKFDKSRLEENRRKFPAGLDADNYTCFID